MGSLWSVSDETTAVLVADFYDAMDIPGLNKAGALRQAQQKLMADARFRHPYFWAPFTLINNWL
jgi:CHAT domain-containing protein